MRQELGSIILIALFFAGLIALLVSIQLWVPQRPSDYDDLRNECGLEQDAAASPLCQAFLAGKIQFPEDASTDYFPFFGRETFAMLALGAIAFIGAAGCWLIVLALGRRLERSRTQV